MLADGTRALRRLRQASPALADWAATVEPARFRELVAK
jgi:hypothetical protein